MDQVKMRLDKRDDIVINCTSSSIFFPDFSQSFEIGVLEWTDDEQFPVLKSNQDFKYYLSNKFDQQLTSASSADVTPNKSLKVYSEASKAKIEIESYAKNHRIRLQSFKQVLHWKVPEFLNNSRGQMAGVSETGGTGQLLEAQKLYKVDYVTSRIKD
jgi:hypothetical protein